MYTLCLNPVWSRTILIEIIIISVIISNWAWGSHYSINLFVRTLVGTRSCDSSTTFRLSSASCGQTKLIRFYSGEASSILCRAATRSKTGEASPMLHAVTSLVMPWAQERHRHPRLHGGYSHRWGLLIAFWLLRASEQLLKPMLHGREPEQFLRPEYIKLHHGSPQVCMWWFLSRTFLRTAIDGRGAVNTGLALAWVIKNFPSITQWGFLSQITCRGSGRFRWA